MKELDLKLRFGSLGLLRGKNDDSKIEKRKIILER